MAQKIKTEDIMLKLEPHDVATRKAAGGYAQAASMAVDRCIYVWTDVPTVDSLNSDPMPMTSVFDDLPGNACGRVLSDRNLLLFFPARNAQPSVHLWASRSKLEAKSGILKNAIARNSFRLDMRAINKGLQQAVFSASSVARTYAIPFGRKEAYDTADAPRTRMDTRLRADAAPQEFSCLILHEASPIAYKAIVDWCEGPSASSADATSSQIAWRMHRTLQFERLIESCDVLEFGSDTSDLEEQANIGEAALVAKAIYMLASRLGLMDLAAEALSQYRQRLSGQQALIDLFGAKVEDWKDLEAICVEMGVWEWRKMQEDTASGQMRINALVRPSQPHGLVYRTTMLLRLMQEAKTCEGQDSTVTARKRKCSAT